MQEVLLNKEMIAVHQDALAVAGDRVGFWNGDGCTPNQGCQVWAKPLQVRGMCARAPRGTHARAHCAAQNGDLAVVLYNRDEEARTISAPFSLLGVTWQQARVRDLWAHADLQPAQLNLTVAAIPAHGVAALRLSKAD